MGKHRRIPVLSTSSLIPAAYTAVFLFRMPEIKLTYFNIEGKAELIRLLLHAGNFHFDDFRVRSSRIPLPETLPEEAPLWSATLKSATTFGQVPTLVWDGVELAQSTAIARFEVVRG